MDIVAFAMGSCFRLKFFDQQISHILLAIVILVGSSTSLFAREITSKGVNTWLLGSLPNNVNYVRDLGAGIVRVDLPWEQVQPGPNQFNWNKIDAVVETASGSDLQVLFTLRSISSWATKLQAQPHDLYHHASLPKSMADWENFIRTLAAHYKSRRVSYEIENEVNANFWAGSLPDYLELLKASYRAIKSADSNARVLPSAMACGIIFDQRTRQAQDRFRQHSDEWLQPILATRAFDVVSVHDYYFPSGPPVNGWTFSSYLSHTAQLMERAGVEGKPIWITETGYVSRPVRAGARIDDGSLDKQADWLIQAYRQAKEFGVERTFWLFLRDTGKAGYFDAMGLADAQNTPRPAWQAYKDLDRK
jgi:hypothetical protein